MCEDLFTRHTSAQCAVHARSHSLRTYLGLLAVGLIATTARASDSLGGCFPITLDDVASLNPPAFDHYPAKRVSGQPSKVDLASHPLAHRYRTMLRTQAREGANFAGHYAIAGWGCGSSCLQFAIIDSTTGKVYFPPDIVSVSTVHVDETPTEPEPTFNGLRYSASSRLLIVLGAANEDASREGIAYYEWTGKALERIRWFKSEKTDWCEEFRDQ